MHVPCKSNMLSCGHTSSKQDHSNKEGENYRVNQALIYHKKATQMGWSIKVMAESFYMQACKYHAPARCKSLIPLPMRAQPLKRGEQSYFSFVQRSHGFVQVPNASLPSLSHAAHVTWAATNSSTRPLLFLGRQMPRRQLDLLMTQLGQGRWRQAGDR